MKSRVSIVRCADYQPLLVKESVEQALNLLGGITQFIRPASRVLVKPNLLMAKEPEAGVCTHPEILRSVIQLLKEINCRVFVGDGPSVWGNQIENVDEVYKRSGVEQVCKEEEVDLVKFDQRRWRGNFPLCAMLEQCDYLVNLPKFKTHDLTTLTAGIKNLFGLVCGTFKTELHKKYFAVDDFSKMLVDIYKIVSPALTIVDGVLAMEGDGPASGGKIRKQNLIIAGADCVAIDALLAVIMGILPSDIPTTRIAAEQGLGNANLDSIEVLGMSLDAAKTRPFILPTTSLKKRIPRPLAKLAIKLIRYYPFCVYENCISCSACIDACPNKAITMKKEKISFDYHKCLACFCCQEACPASAIGVRKSLVAKLIGL